MPTSGAAYAFPVRIHGKRSDRDRRERCNRLREAGPEHRAGDAGDRKGGEGGRRDEGG